MTSVVIAAHNEAAVITRCLESLAANKVGLEVVVVPNGCTDDTAARARRAGSRVVEIDTANKAAALNAGDVAATTFPRLYLDADIAVPPGGVEALVRALQGSSGALAAVPARRLDTAGRPLLVRGYFAVQARLPVHRDGLFGRGLVALSDEGRSRFSVFPNMVADDLFLDALFEKSEKVIVQSVVVTVETPYRTRDLIRRLVRVRRGNAEMRRASAEGAVPAAVRPADRLAWLRDVWPRPRLWPAGAAYAALTVSAAIWARATPGSNGWARDESTRRSRPSDVGAEQSS